MSTNKLRLEQSRHLYGILEIPNFSSIEEVRVAYKTLALRYHPDKNLDDPHASERFKEVCAVYELLVNEATKKRYDTALRMFHICTGAPSSSNSTTASTTTAAWSRRGVHKDEGDVDGVTKKRSASHRDSDATLPTAAGSRSSSYANFAEAAYSSSSTTTHRPGHSGFAASSPSTRSGSDRAAAASHYTEEQKQDFRRRESERIARLCKHMQEMKMAKREHERVAQQRALDRRAHWDEQRRAVHQRAFSANQPSQRTSSARSNGHGTRGGEAAPTAIPVDHTSNGTSGTASHGISDDVNYTNSSNRTSSSNHNRSSDRHSSYSNACRAPVGQHSEEEATAFSGGGHIGDSVHSLRESFATHGANGAVPPTSPSHLQDLHRAHADNTSFTTTGTTPVTDAASSRHPPLPVRTRSRVSSSRSSSTYLCAAGAKEGHGLGETPASTMTPHGVTQACRSVGGRGELVRDARAMAAPDRCTTPRRHQQDTPRHPPPRRKLGAGDNTITTASIEDDHHYNSNNIHEHEETDWSIGHTLTQTDVHAEKDCKVHAIDTRTGSACKDSINGGTSDLTAAAGAVSVASSRHAGGSVSIMRGRDVHRTAAARKEQSANAAPLPPQRVTRTVSVHRTPCATATRGVKNTSANTIIMTTTPVMTNSNNNSKDCHSSDDDRGGDESVQHEQEQEQKTRSRNAGAGVWKAVHEETAARVRLTQLQHREWTRLMVERVHGTTLMLGSSNNSSHIKQCVPSEKENVSDDACEKDVRWPVRTASPTSVSSVIHTNNVSSLSLPTLAVKQLAETRLCVDNGLRCDQKHTNGGATMVQRVRVVSSLAQLTQKELLDRAAIEQCHEDDTTELIRWHARVRHHRYAVEKAAAVRLTQSRYHYEMTAMRAQIVHLKEIIARMSENTVSHAFQETAFHGAVQSS